MSSRVNDQLGRILASPQFRDSLRLQSLLRFVVTLTLQGKADQIKESTIALEVFGRKETGADSIVRSAAARLRAKLEQYYVQDGADDSIRISIPKGGYVAEIQERTAPVGMDEPTGGDGAVPGRFAWKSFSITAAASVLLAALIAAAILWRNREQPERAANYEARELYLQGRYHWNKRTPEDLNRALDYFTQAVVKDPRYAQAYVGLADAYNLFSEYTVMPYSEAFKRGMAAAKTAIRLDDNLPEAHNSLAFASFYGAWDTVTAEREFKRALRLNPNYGTAHHWYATFLMSLGREREALIEVTRAQVLDPSSKSILADKGLILLWAGQLDAARTLLEQMEASDPEFASPHRYLASVYLFDRRYGDYLSELRKDALLTHSASGLAVAEAGKKGLAKGVAGMVEEMMRTQQIFSAGDSARYDYWLAHMSALSGNRNDAIRFLQLAFDRHDVNMVTLTADPFFASLRDDRAFQELVRRVGVVPRAPGA
jgi:Tfp pilus assembly protein PilF